MIPERWFIRTGRTGGARLVHALYFDRVDVVAADFVGATSFVAIEAVLLRIEQLGKDQLKELTKQTAALETGKVEGEKHNGLGHTSNEMGQRGKGVAG